MTSVAVRRLTKTNDESVLRAQSRRMKPMRLRSLQQDPDSFVSTYDGECNQPEEFWLDRLRPAFVQHWYAVIEDGKVQSDEDRSYEGEWVAFLVMLDEDAITNSSQQTAAELNQDNSAASYKMAALWVDPVVRGKGVGRRMISDAMHLVKAQLKVRNKQVAHINLSARKDNVGAIRLYTSLGFQISNQNSVIESEDRETAAVDMRFEVTV